jgi:hypothetical protein
MDIENGYGVAILSYGAGIFKADENNDKPIWTKKIRKRLSETAHGRLQKAPMIKVVVWCRENTKDYVDVKKLCKAMFHFKITDVSKLLVLGGSKTLPILRSYVGRFGVSGKRTKGESDVCISVASKINQLKSEIFYSL